MIHALTVDVEDYHNINARDRLGRDEPPTRAVVNNTERLLQIFADYGVRATFFVLGEVATTFPDLIRHIVDQGHELGVHGFYHRQVFKLSPEEFRREIVEARSAIERISGVPVLGHRAAAFSIMPQTKWALAVLAEAGFHYDSSIFPIAGRRYGWPGFPRDIHQMQLDDKLSIIEAPLSTVSLFGRLPLPACGGGYLRHFPAAYTIWSVRHIQRQRPVIVYLHPYELELDCGIDTSLVNAFTACRARLFHRLQLRNRHTVERKIVQLVSRFDFAPLSEVISYRLGRSSAVNTRASTRER